MTEIEIINDHKKKRPKNYYFKWAVFLIFAGIFCFVVYTSFFGGMGFTGSVINGGDTRIVPDKLLDFNAQLNTPLLDLNGKFQKVEIKGSSDSFLTVGDQKFYLGNVSSNYIVFSNFEGEIAFNESKISKLSGKASQVIINGITMVPQTKNTSKVSLQSSMNYNLLDIMNEAQIKKVSYSATGSINVEKGKNAIHVKDEQITITNFIGNIEVTNGNMNLSGKVQGLDVAGKTNIHIGS